MIEYSNGHAQLLWQDGSAVLLSRCSLQWDVAGGRAGRATGVRCHLLCGCATAAPSRRRALCASWHCPLWYCACLAHAHGALRPEAVHARAPCLDQARHAWKGKSAEIFALPHHSGHAQRDATDAMGALVAALARVLSFELGGCVVSGSFGKHAIRGATLLGMVFGPSQAKLSCLFRNSTSATMPRQK